jgi:predicted Zn-dependent protease
MLSVSDKEYYCVYAYNNKKRYHLYVPSEQDQYDNFTCGSCKYPFKWIQIKSNQCLKKLFGKLTVKFTLKQFNDCLNRLKHIMQIRKNPDDVTDDETDAEEEWNTLAIKDAIEIMDNIVAQYPTHSQPKYIWVAYIVDVTIY